MSFDIRDLQELPEVEPADKEALRITNCFKHAGCTDL